MNLNQLYILFNFILTGIIIGILFDIFRILRKSFKTSDIITYIQDFIFWVLTGTILLFSIFIFNNGELRGYIFIGIIIGIIVYMTLLSKYFIKIFVTIINFIKKIILYPLKKLLTFFLKNVSKHINIFFNKISLKSPKITLKNAKKNKLYDKIQ